MSASLSHLGLWFWHLLPANPILVRVVHGGSRRPRHLWLRVGYLAVLLAVVVLSLIGFTSGQSSSLTDLAKGASQTFKFASMVQLALICFLAPVFTASAITQERDAQTFNILITTPLTNAQIVFGSLLSRLYFLVLLLLSGLPIFLMTMIYGGVTSSQVLRSFAISGSTAVLTGALAIAVAMIRVGTRRTIFSFYLLIFLYLLVIQAAGSWSGTWVDAAPTDPSTGQKMSWLAPLHPFLALSVALNVVPAPDASLLADYPGFMRFALANPPRAYVVWTLMVALLLTCGSIAFVRRGSKLGETTLVSGLLGRLLPRRGGERRRPPRNVWSNPVAWREAKTKAAGGGWLRWVILAGGVLGSLLLFSSYRDRPAAAGEFRFWLATLISAQLGLALLIAANTAATSMTKEKEARTMDLLLTTMLTSRYILWGKLRGLVSFCAPLIAGPVFILLLFGLHDIVRPGAALGVWIDTSVELGLLMLAFTGFACVLSLKISLTSKTNMAAVMTSIGVLIVLCGIVSAIGEGIVTASGGEVGAFFAPFTPWTAVYRLIDPASLYETPREFLLAGSAPRVAAVIGSALSTMVYVIIVYQVYIGLVRNFDRIVRRQSGT
jgi:ABC-type transport system involved in multi-copper enzyme maturation permease subunit